MHLSVSTDSIQSYPRRLEERLAWELNSRNFGYHPRFSFGCLSWALAFGTANPSIGFLVPGKRLLYFRIVCLLYALSVLVTSLYSFIEDGSITQWIFYFTNLSVLLTVFYFTISIYTTYKAEQALAEKEKYNVSDKVPFHAIVTWRIFEIALPTSLCAAILYWGLIYTYLGVFNAPSLMDHGIIQLFLILDAIAGRQPYLLAHVIYVVPFWMFYLFWSWVFYKAGFHNKYDGGNYVYINLNWDQPEYIYLKLTVAGMVLFTPILYFFLWIFIATNRSVPIHPYCTPTEVQNKA